MYTNLKFSCHQVQIISHLDYNSCFLRHLTWVWFAIPCLLNMILMIYSTITIIFISAKKLEINIKEKDRCIHRDLMELNGICNFLITKGLDFLEDTLRNSCMLCTWDNRIKSTKLWTKTTSRVKTNHYQNRTFSLLVSIRRIL